MRPAVANRALSQQVIRKETVPKAAFGRKTAFPDKWTFAGSVWLASFRSRHFATTIPLDNGTSPVFVQLVSACGLRRIRELRLTWRIGCALQRGDGGTRRLTNGDPLLDVASSVVRTHRVITQ